MASTAYTIGKDELLLITVKWIDGVNKGLSNVLETEMRQYKAAEIQALIDETVSDKCTVIDVEAYDRVKKCGMSIADDFDVRSFAEREMDRRTDEDEEEEVRFRRVYNARRPSAGNITHAMQGVGAGCMSEHERIWLEPYPGDDPEGRNWCQHDIWGDGVEYVHVSKVAALEEALTDCLRHLRENFKDNDSIWVRRGIDALAPSHRASNKG